ncbi:glucan biosynthesis protein [Amorphus orientalis]|uniref:Glucans biosynthesis protein G n=1 Tax=Amorphus orientalis TaxID=649198 RepID=A0AAE3VLC9_9HYPH|nr:glucan biosynthesis protein G [Amorphus orientalis]MDQ0314048.1 glucans biosynthesis protein [Amorphus orientalis]
MITRRSVIGGLSGAIASSALIGSARAQDTAAEPSADPNSNAFSFDALTERMKARAAEAYTPPSSSVPDHIRQLDYEAYKQVAFRPDRAIWEGTDLPFRLQAFHTGWLFNEPVRLFEVVDGEARELTFSTEDFEYRPPLDAETFRNTELPGVAGFRVHFPLNRADVFDEVIAFQGASYFRAVGYGNVYGISARGLAIDTASSREEEFPRFTEFYIERPTPQSRQIRIYAALDSESVTGAYAFTVTPGRDTITDVTARLFFRNDVQRLGVAPMTSMFLYGENNRATFDDYRARVHDSEGLRIVRNNGDEIWRHLNNPRVLANSFFGEENPVSFALNQRHRAFADYEDAEARYDKRPSLRVEPRHGFEKGHVQLVEIPADADHMDNIVAFWTPADPIQAGASPEYAYRMVWGDAGSEESTLALAVSTRTGIGGTSGSRDDSIRKFVVDFSGGMLRGLRPDAPVTPATYVGGGEVVTSSLARVEDGLWRFAIDIRPEGERPVEMAVRLTVADRPLTETWLYQWRRGDENRRD